MKQVEKTSISTRALGGLRGGLRRIVKKARWLFVDFARAPGLELYSEFEDRKSRRFFEQNLAWSAAAEDPHLRPFYPRRIPKTVWMFWAQGEAAAPLVVRRCIESWRRHNPGWEIRVLDTDMAAALVDTSDVPAFLPMRCHANMLRLRLLRRFGGVWADATVLCHRPLDGWLPLQAASGFFVFSRPGPGRSFDNWFVASEPEGTLVSAWEESYGDYITHCTKKSRKYFMFIYTLQWRLRTDPEARAAWERTATLPAGPTFLLAWASKGITPPDAVRGAIAAGLPVSKLSWKSNVPDEEVGRILDELAPGPGKRAAAE